jgi:hypothetical protein
MKTGNYRATSYYLDEKDREYTLQGEWYYENGFNEIPDTWELQSLEVESQEPGSQGIEHLLTKDGDIWRMVERDGAIRDAEYIDDRDPEDFYYYNEEIF